MKTGITAPPCSTAHPRAGLSVRRRSFRNHTSVALVEFPMDSQSPGSVYVWKPMSRGAFSDASARADELRPAGSEARHARIALDADPLAAEAERDAPRSRPCESAARSRQGCCRRSVSWIRCATCTFGEAPGARGPCGFADVMDQGPLRGQDDGDLVGGTTRLLGQGQGVLRARSWLPGRLGLAVGELRVGCWRAVEVTE